MHSGLIGYVPQCLMMFIEWGEDTRTVESFLSDSILEVQWAAGPPYNIGTFMSATCLNFHSPM